MNYDNVLIKEKLVFILPLILLFSISASAQIRPLSVMITNEDYNVQMAGFCLEEARQSYGMFSQAKFSSSLNILPVRE